MDITNCRGFKFVANHSPERESGFTITFGHVERVVSGTVECSDAIKARYCFIENSDICFNITITCADILYGLFCELTESCEHQSSDIADKILAECFSRIGTESIMLLIRHSHSRGMESGKNDMRRRFREFVDEFTKTE